MTTTHDVVAALGPAIAQRIGEPRYRLWFADNTKFTCQENRLTVGVPNRFYQEWLQNTFSSSVAEAARALLGHPVTVHFVIDGPLFQAQRSQEKAAAESPAPPLEKPAPTGGRRCRGFEEFVVGPCNRLAHAAALSLAERPGLTPNPLTLYGPVGVGKTHLLEGMCAGLRAAGGDVIFVTGEEFTNRFLHALKGGKLGPFRHEFRDCRALLLDNVHFLAHKEATQEEFLHTLEALQKRDRPVVVTSDCYPKLIPHFLPELTDRLLGGVVWGMDAPDIETRRSILIAKAEKLGCALPDDAVDFLVHELRNNVRELEGALHSIHHYALAHGRPITLALVREATSDLVRHTIRVIQLKEVERAVCDVLHLEGRILHAKGRTREITQPRMLAMHLARKHTRAAYSEIGRFFGGRNHSTAIAADRKVADWVETNAPLFINGQRWLTRDLLERAERGLTQ